MENVNRKTEKIGCMTMISFITVLPTLLLLVLKWTDVLQLSAFQCFIPFLVVSVPLFTFGFAVELSEFIGDLFNTFRR